VVELLHWSFVIALTCMALDLVRRLISAFGHWIGRELLQLSEDDEPWGPPRTTSRHSASCYVPISGTSPSLKTARSLAPDRRRSLGESGGFSIY
jgi:hypothetical protein